MGYKINYMSYPFESVVYRPTDDGKINFFDNNLSLKVCTAMILCKNENDVEKYGDFHRIFYGRYLAGFAYEGNKTLPPLCILHTIHENKAVNAVYYNGTVYDPKLGVFTFSEYEKKNIVILSYTQMFIQEAYEDTDWQPFIPVEIQAELKKDTELAVFFHSLPPLQQSKILNYIYPFSKPSSFKEIRKMIKPITSTKVQHIVSYIKSFMPIAASKIPTWEELQIFETDEAVKTLKRCGITEGMTVLDMGCGHGHYTFAASIATGAEGKVIAVDKDKYVLKHVESKATEYNLKKIFCLKTNEKGLSEYKENIDFSILYDVLHGLFNFSKADWGKTTKIEFVDNLVSLLKKDGILSLALYSEIECKRVPFITKTGKDSFKLVQVPHEEAIKPYIRLMEASGLELYKVIENGGVHFDDFHNPTKWRKFGEIKISSLERRNIYNFKKLN